MLLALPGGVEDGVDQPIDIAVVQAGHSAGLKRVEPGGAGAKSGLGAGAVTGLLAGLMAGARWAGPAGPGG